MTTTLGKYEDLTYPYFRTRITQEEYDRAFEFCGGVQHTVSDERARRNQSNPEKNKLDDFIGKIGEFAARNFLIARGSDVLGPDLAIYNSHSKNLSMVEKSMARTRAKHAPKDALSTGRKEHGADLIADGRRIHIKTQSISSAQSFTASWLFQKDYVDRIRDNSETLGDAIFFVLLNDQEGWAPNTGSPPECFVLPAIYNLEHLVWGVPKAPHLRSGKKAVYAKDHEGVAEIARKVADDLGIRRITLLGE